MWIWTVYSIFFFLLNILHGMFSFENNVKPPRVRVGWRCEPVGGSPVRESHVSVGPSGRKQNSLPDRPTRPHGNRGTQTRVHTWTPQKVDLYCTSKNPNTRAHPLLCFSFSFFKLKKKNITSTRAHDSGIVRLRHTLTLCAPAPHKLSCNSATEIARKQMYSQFWI